MKLQNEYITSLDWRLLISPAQSASQKLLATFISRELQWKLDLPTYSAPAAAIVGLKDAVVASRRKKCIVSLRSPIV